MTKRPTRPIPLGTYHPMTDDEAATYAGTVTPADVELLRSQWKKYASPRYRALIDAGTVEPLRLGGQEDG